MIKSRTCNKCEKEINMFFDGGTGNDLYFICCNCLVKFHKKKYPNCEFKETRLHKSMFGWDLSEHGSSLNCIQYRLNLDNDFRKKHKGKIAPKGYKSILEQILGKNKYLKLKESIWAMHCNKGSVPRETK